MKFTKILCLILFPVILFSQIPYDKKYKFIRTEHFEIIYHTEKSQAIQIARLAEGIHLKLSKKFFIPDKIKTTIILIDNFDIANGLTTIIPGNIIILYDTPPDSFTEFELLNYYNFLEELILHEYVHILHLNQDYNDWHLLRELGFKYLAPNALLPLSSIEGLPVCMESYYTPMGRAKSSFKDMIIRSAVYENRVPKIDQISTFINRIPFGYGPYIWGGDFHYYIIKKYSEESMLKAYNSNGSLYGCCLSPFYSKILNAFSTCITLFPLNSLFEKYTGKSYYEIYNEYQEFIIKKYKDEISTIKNPTLSEPLIAKKFWEIYDLEIYKNKIYFSAFSPHTGNGIYVYDLNTKKLKTLIKNIYATSLTIFENSLFFTAFEYYNNNYFFSGLYKFDFNNKKLTFLENLKRVSYVKKIDKGLVIVKNSERKKEIYFYNPLSNILSKIAEFDKYDILANFVSLSEDEIAFIMKKESDFFDIYSIDLNNLVIKRLTENPGIETSLLKYRNELYFVADYDGRFNIYKYDLKTKKIYKLTDLITGILRFTVYDDKFYAVEYKTEGQILSKLEIKNFQTNEYKTNFNYKNYEIPVDRIDYNEVKSISDEKDYSFFRNMFRNFLTFPYFYLYNDSSIYSGITLIFQDVLYRNSLSLDINYSNNPEDYGIGAGYNIKWNKTFLNLSFLFYNNFRNFGISPQFGIYKSKFRYNYYISAGNLFYYSDESKYNFIFVNFNFRNYFKYRYSVVPENGFKFNIQFSKEFKINYQSLDLLNLNFEKYIETFIPHHIIIFNADTGMTLNSTGTKIFQFTNFEFFKNLFFYKLFSTGYSDYNESFKNYLLSELSYNFPLFWIERGIKNMPLLLRNFWFKFYYQSGNGFNKIENLKFLRLVGCELYSGFILFYNIPFETALGFSYELDRRKNKNFYIKIKTISF